MKIKFTKNTMANGRIYEADEEANLPDELAKTCLQQGMAIKVESPAVINTPTK